MFRIKLETPTPANSCLIELTRGKFAIVDHPIPRRVLAFRWTAAKWNFRWYAYATKLLDGTPARIAMHRLIAETPPNEICHHANGHSLDNRLSNLMNMTNRHHAQLHGIRRWGRKKKVKTSEKRQ